MDTKDTRLVTEINQIPYFYSQIILKVCYKHIREVAAFVRFIRSSMLGQGALGLRSAPEYHFSYQARTVPAAAAHLTAWPSSSQANLSATLWDWRVTGYFLVFDPRMPTLSAVCLGVWCASSLCVVMWKASTRVRDHCGHCCIRGSEGTVSQIRIASCY